MPRKVLLRDQIHHAVCLAQSDCGAFGSEVLDEILDNLHLIPNSLSFDVPTIKERFESKARAREQK